MVFFFIITGIFWLTIKSFGQDSNVKKTKQNLKNNRSVSDEHDNVMQHIQLFQQRHRM